MDIKPETFEQKMKRAFVAIQDVKIPDMPEDIIALDREMQARYPSQATMAEIIGRNTILAAELLRIANSPSMRPPQTIKSIPQGISVLGTKNLKNLLLASALREVFGSAREIREIMEHSASVGLCAAELAQYVHGIEAGEAYACALFHNCGAILLMIKDKRAYRDIFLDSHSLPLSAIEKEEKAFNTNHTATGLLLGKKWQLSHTILNAIYEHHTPSCSTIKNEQARLLVALLKVANGIVAESSLGAYIGQEMQDYIQDGIDTLMLTPEQVASVQSFEKARS